MQTELQVSVIYLAQEENDINEFDFFIRMIPTEDKNIVSVSAVPRFSLDGKAVKHLRFSVASKEALYAFDVLQMISKLKELQTIVSDVNLTTADAEAKLKDLMLKAINQYGTEKFLTKKLSKASKTLLFLC